MGHVKTVHASMEVGVSPRVRVVKARCAFPFRIVPLSIIAASLSRDAPRLMKLAKLHGQLSTANEPCLASCPPCACMTTPRCYVAHRMQSKLVIEQ